MSNLTYENAAELVAACRTAAEEAGKALGRALGGTFQVEVKDEPRRYAPGTLPDSCNGGGLAMVIQWGDAGLVALLPEASGLLPAWYRQPGATEQSRLDTLALELRATLLPEELAATSTRAAKVDALAQAVVRGEPQTPAGQIELTLHGDDGVGSLYIIWPLTRGEAVLVEDGATAGDAPAGGRQPGERPAEAEADRGEETAHRTPPTATSAEMGDEATAIANLLDQLPPYARSLLKIRVPVAVRLASKRQTIRQILQLSPGTIINFDKSCDQMLELSAGGCTIATGEAVKVGDKFGLRIHAITRPHERFRKVYRRA